jgi:subtilisin-like proprotein convertase family protein
MRQHRVQHAGGSHVCIQTNRLTTSCVIMLFCCGVILGGRAQNCNPPPSGLVGWWSGDGNANTLVGTNNGTLQGGATANGVGMVGQAFSFNGTSAYVQVPDSAVLRPTNFTIEAWVQFSSLNGTGNAQAGQQYIVFKQNTRSSYFEGYYLGKERRGNNDVFAFAVTSSSAAQAGVYSTTPISTGTWYHVVAARGSNFLQLFINGQSVGQTNVSFAQNYGTQPLFFGSSGQSYWDRKFAGLLDEVSLYNRALSASEVAALYAAGPAGKCKAGSPPTITTPPLGRTVAVGSNVLFTVTASGTAPLSYQWQWNGGPINGATTTSYTVNNAQTTDSGNYSVVVTNSSGSVTSAVAILSVLIPPNFTLQPQDATLTAGSTANFNGSASGSTPLSYQWRLQGTNLVNNARVSGATSSSLSITAVQATDAGAYTLLANNAIGSVTSSPAVLTVNGPPVVTTPPASQGVVAGTTALLTVSATGTAPLSYQWQLGGAPIDGATATSLSLPNVQPANQGNYTVVVTNSAGSVTSAVAVLTVLVPPSIALQPGSQTNNAGGAAAFSVNAGGSTPLSYQWRLNNGALSNGGRLGGVTTSALSISSLQASDAGNYTVVVTNSGGSVTSAVAVLTVLVPPSISTQPANQSVTLGANTGFNVVASGTAPLSYQWQWYGTNLSNGSQISGATTSALALSSVQATNAGGYSVIVTNVAGAITSSVASLTISSGTSAGTFANSAAITIPDSGAATPYPSSVTVAGMAGVVSKATVALTGVSHTYVHDVNVVLVGPGGQTALLMAHVGSTLGVTNINLTFDDAAASSLPTTSRVLAGTFKPTNGGGTLAFPSPAPAGSYGSALAALNGANPNGVWSLYVMDDAVNDKGTISGGWSLTLSTSNSAPTISVQPSSVSVIAGSSVGFSVTALGTAPLSYQWLFNGTILAEGGQVGGSKTSALSLANVQAGNGGPYAVVVSNPYGSVTSSVATLTVNLPGACAPVPSGLVGWWPADGNGGDIVGNNNGTLVGGATASGAGMVGSAFNFNGTDGYLQIPDSAALRPTNLTVECWVKFSSLDSVGNSTAGAQYIVFKQNTRNNTFEGYNLSKHRYATDIIVWEVSSATGVAVQINGVTAIQTNVWYHLAGVRGPNSVQLYVNGQLEAQASVNFPQDYGNYPLYFGTSGESYWDHKLAGSLDEVSLYNRALSASEIAAIYAAGSGGKCRGASPPAIASQPANQTYVAGGTATFAVTANGTAPLYYRWYKDGFLVTDSPRTVGSSNSVLTISSLQSLDIGNYQVVVSNALGSVTSAVAALSPGSPPANDNFASAQAISGSSGSVSGNNFNATKQAGEPSHAGNSGGASVWYNWTAPSTSPVTFDTAMSGFDTLLAVYTGNSLSALTPIASNNDLNANSTRSRVTFTPTSGTVYRIAVDGNNGLTGNLTLRWVQGTIALPDLSIVASAVNARVTTETFAANSCAVLEGLVQPGTRTLIRFDTETENSGTADLFFGNPAANPLFVWAPCHAHYHFNNYMSYRLRDANGNIAALGLKVGFCVLDVFRWSPSAATTAKYNCNSQGIQVGWGDLYDSTLDGQWIDITGLPSGNYTMEMEANPQGIILEANYGNNVATVPIVIGNPTAPPANNNFASAQTLLGGFTSVLGNNQNATKESGEPNHAGNAGGHSLWYKWTAPSTLPVTLDTIGSSFNTLLAVYTGNSLSALTPVTSNDDISNPANLQSQVTFNATAGVVYDIAVDGFGGATGSVVLTLTQTIQNDNFSFLTYIGGGGGSVRGSNLGATKEAGEPNHGGNAGGASIWYGWTAPISGVATFNTVGSTFNTLLSVYTGTALNNLTQVASNDDIDAAGNLQSQVSFNVVGLTRYNIAIDGFNGATGDTLLGWSLSGGLVSPLVSGPALDLSQAEIPPAPGTPPILENRFLSAGEFQLHISGPAYQRYLIEVSADLTDWRPLISTVADNLGQAFFTDKSSHSQNRAAINDPVCGQIAIAGLAAPSRTARFYRAVPIGARVN